MNKQNTVSMVTHVIFFGALWGLLEATLGFVLHMIPVPFIAGSIMFPIGVLILITAYKKLPSRQTLIYIGMIAAAIKSINLLTPLPHFSVINPMMSIVFQSLLVIGTIGYLSKNHYPTQISAFVTASIGWRVMFIVWHGVLIALPISFFSPHLETMVALNQFVVIEGLLSATLGIILLKGLLMIRPMIKPMPLKPVHAMVILTISLYVSYLL